ncbi:hypothetical protein CcCBS67573_g03939 [Chytriomyces confervae]|uniref:F-box domain-containing protein n=1 Tax=Chytriomyces confervae TaxID=246404 RepID=A0A507FEY3_9FUNG|nr:hypothetical protein CcCBS67573_g03939 [Chytriomyces confervae]
MTREGKTRASAGSKRARTEDVSASEAPRMPPAEANSDILAIILREVTALKVAISAQQNLSYQQQHLSNQVASINDTLLSIVNTQRHLSIQVQGLANRHKKFYTRLQDLPIEIIGQIFAWIPVQTVFKYRRLSRTINERLLSTEFAVLNLHLPDFVTKSKRKIGGLWLVLPESYQTVIARAVTSRVETVNCSKSIIKKRIPKSISCLTAVQEIWLNDSTLSGAIPDAFGALNNLTTLSLRCNSLTGELPSSFSLLSGLRFLDLSFNQLSGEFPAMPSTNALETIFIGKNRFTGPIPTIFGDPHKLISLFAEDNFFSVIPSSVGRLTSLEFLKISGNPIASEIPSEIWNLAALRCLDMHSCQMLGSLAGMGALRNLVELDVSNNEFSGRLPSREIYNMQSLQELHLIQNQFSGSEGKMLDISRTSLMSMCADPDFQRDHVKGVLQCHIPHDWAPRTEHLSDSDSEHEQEPESDGESDSDSDSDSEFE